MFSCVLSSNSCAQPAVLVAFSCRRLPWVWVLFMRQVRPKKDKVWDWASAALVPCLLHHRVVVVHLCSPLWGPAGSVLKAGQGAPSPVCACLPAGGRAEGEVGRDPP